MKMKKRHLICQDLRDNIIDVEAIGRIAADAGKYHIYGLRFKILRYVMIVEELPRRVGLKHYDVEITFSKREEGNRQITTMDGTIYFFVEGINYRIRMRLQADAVYEFTPYDLKIQNYLYSYFTHMVEHDKRIQSITRVKLPDAISNYYPGIEWENQYVKDYYWRDFETRTPMNVTEAATLHKVERQSEVSRLFESLLNKKIQEQTNTNNKEDNENE